VSRGGFRRRPGARGQWRLKPPLHHGALMQPNFDADERYILAYYKADFVKSLRWDYWIVYALTLCMFVYGIVGHDEAFMFSAFGILFTFEVFIALRQPRYFRITRSIIDKYEKRIEELAGNPRGRE
jgi:hypothetical protein